MKIALIGQPNCGKSTFFNAVVGYRSLTSNFPGTTVEYALGHSRVAGEDIELVDLPGLYSLTPANPAEICSRAHLLAGGWDAVINVIDASQLARSLELTLELRELQLPLVVCLNMMDEATRKGIQINAAQLSEKLGVPVLEAIATRGQGIVETMRAGVAASRQSVVLRPLPRYSAEVECVVDWLAGRLASLQGETHRASRNATPSVGDLHAPSPTSSAPIASAVVAAPLEMAATQARFLAVQLLQADPQLLECWGDPAAEAVREASDRLWRKTGQHADAAISSARHAACLEIFKQVARVRKPHIDWRDRVDRLLMHPFWGYFCLAAMFYGFFRLVFGMGQILEGHILVGFDALISHIGHLMNSSGIPYAVTKGALLGTAGAFAVVLPYLVPFLIGLAILEDVGYLARVGYLMDAAMHRMGLHGTATIPILLGYGCSVPAVMATRILSSRRDRFVAAFLAVLVPCSARMTVIMALVGFYLGALWALGVYVLNLAVVALAGIVLARLWPEISPGMLMQVPPYRRPSARVVLLKTWWRLREFVLVALPLLVAGSAVLGLIEYFGWQARINSLLSPLTGLLGLPLGVGLTLVFGLLRKELSLLMLMQALGTTNVGSAMSAAQVVVFTLFVTFYVPCLATLASMVREIGFKLTAAATGALLLLAIAIGALGRAALHLLL